MPQHPSGYQHCSVLAIRANHNQEPLPESRSLWCDKVSACVTGSRRSLQGSAEPHRLAANNIYIIICICVCNHKACIIHGIYKQI